MRIPHPCSGLTPPFGVLLLLTGLAVGAQPNSYSEAVGVMKREQTLGEAHAGLLKGLAKDDTATLARGIALYAQAEADFNALIETLKAELKTGGSLEDSEGFMDALKRAADQRVAFTSFVDDKVISRTEEGTRSIAAVIGGLAVAKDAAELIENLTGVGLDIWREYRAAEQSRRQQILDQLDSLRWKSFGEVPPLG